MCGLHVELLHTHFPKPNGTMFYFVNNFFYRNWFLLTWVKLLSRATLLHSTDYICFRGFGVTTISPKLRCLRLTSSSVILTKMHCFLGFHMNWPGKPHKSSRIPCALQQYLVINPSLLQCLGFLSLPVQVCLKFFDMNEHGTELGVWTWMPWVSRCLNLVK